MDKGVIRSLLLRNGIKCRTAATHLQLTEEHRNYRLAFCELFLKRWDDDMINSIIFSDEKSFCTDVSWRKKVYRPDKTRYMPIYTTTQRIYHQQLLYIFTYIYAGICRLLLHINKKRDYKYDFNESINCRTTAQSIQRKML